MLDWLDDVIEEEDFMKMEQFGVEVVRVPTGYWNWINLGSLTPNGPPEVVERFRNLQIVGPWRYEKYIDLIYQWGEKYNLKIMMEIHGMPGSQSGKQSSGCTIIGEEGDHHFYFNTTWNKELALRTVEKMAEKCSQFSSSCYGVGVINEPPMPKGSYGQSWHQKQKIHEFLDDYFEESIRKVREILPEDVPVILFSWVFDFGKWSKKGQRFPRSEYGNVMWDTHIYTWKMNNGTGKSADVDYVLGLYDHQIQKAVDFQTNQGASVIIGEYTFANFL